MKLSPEDLAKLNAAMFAKERAHMRLRLAEVTMVMRQAAVTLADAQAAQMVRDIRAKYGAPQDFTVSETGTLQPIGMKNGNGHG